VSRSPARPIATASAQTSWPARGPPIGVPVAASHTRTVPSPALETDVPVPGPPDGHRGHPVVVAGRGGTDRGSPTL
jgi:hypothetical protein